MRYSMLRYGVLHTRNILMSEATVRVKPILKRLTNTKNAYKSVSSGCSDAAIVVFGLASINYQYDYFVMMIIGVQINVQSYSSSGWGHSSMINLDGEF